MVWRRNNIVMVKIDVPKKVTLPNGRVLYAKYKRVTTQWLPGGTKIARTYRGQPGKGRRRPFEAPAPAKPAVAVSIVHPRQRLRGRGISDIAQTVANNPFAQKLGKKI